MKTKKKNIKKAKKPAVKANKAISKKEKSKYTTLQEWANMNPGGYRMAYKKGLINKMCKKFGWKSPKKVNLPTYWTLERCLKNSKQFSTTIEWEKFSKNAYQAARRNNWFEECTKHIVPKRKPSGYWTKAQCIKEAKKYSNMSEWKENSKSSYSVASKHKWLKKCTKHVTNKKYKSKYKSLRAWIKAKPEAYNHALSNGMLPKICEMFGWKYKK